MPDEGFLLNDSDIRAIDAASELGCDRILLSAFDKLLSQLSAMTTELSCREAPYCSGILEQAEMIKSRRVAIRKHIEMKNSYKELCTSAMSQSAPFDRLKDLYLRTDRLVQTMREAAAAGESAAINAFRTAEEELSAISAIAREQHAVVLKALRQAMQNIALAGEQKLEQPNRFCSEAEAPFSVVSIDMVAYGAHSEQQESGPWRDPEAVLRLNRRVRSLIVEALAETRANVDEVWQINTGDGGLLIFKAALPAVKFALAFAERVRRSNSEPQGGQRIFRTGVASGNVCVFTWRNVHGRILEMETGGTAIAHAVRIQSACSPNGIMICARTFEMIKTTVEAKEFPYRQRVRGKPHEHLDLRVHSTKDDRGYFRRLWRALLNR
jgi:class 3 adenylate cyclase